MGIRFSQPSSLSEENARQEDVCENKAVPRSGDKTMDTVRQARQEQEKQGPWEVEISYGGEADLQRHLTGCKKYPGHHKFKPVDQFNVEDLPSGCRDSGLVDLVRSLSDVTVRVSVKYVSENRPETFPASDKPFSCYSDRGRNMMRVGTGWVYKVDKYPNEYINYYKTCNCNECRDSPTLKTQFAHICILTGAHVVYDDLEGEHTTCHLFFDKGGIPEVCNGVVTLTGMSRVRSHIDKDRSKMRYVTHDLGLAHRLDKMVRHRNDLMKSVSGRYITLEYEKGKSPPQAESFPDTWRTLTIIVSHPHGCSKHVSVGHCTYKEERVGAWTRYTYTTATCPGSSGAHVFVLGRRWWDGYYGHAHSGNCVGDNELNFSGYGHDSSFP